MAHGKKVPFYFTNICIEITSYNLGVFSPKKLPELLAHKMLVTLTPDGVLHNFDIFTTFPT